MELIDRSAFSYVEEPKSMEKDARCMTCEHYDEDMCQIFQMLSDEHPDLFDMDPQVKDMGYCRAFTPMEASIKNLRKKSRNMDRATTKPTPTPDKEDAVDGGDDEASEGNE